MERKASEEPSDQEEQRLRALAPAVSAYNDFILARPGLLRHQHLRRLLALSQRLSPELFVRSVERAHRYRITSLATLEAIARLLPRTLDELATVKGIGPAKLKRYGDELQIVHPDHIAPVGDVKPVALVEPVYPLSEGITSNRLQVRASSERRTTARGSTS